MNCPKCSSVNIKRSRHRNRWEAWRKSIFKRRVYRCHDCNWRGWRKSSTEDGSTRPRYKMITYLIVILLALLAAWLLLPYLE